MFFIGDMYYKDSTCSLDSTDMDFMGDNTDSQIVISQSALTCMLNQIAKSNIGRIHVNTHSFNNFFQLNELNKNETLRFDSTVLNTTVPMIEKKIGKHKELMALLEFKDIEVEIGKGEADLVFEYTLGVSLVLS